MDTKGLRLAENNRVTAFLKNSEKFNEIREKFTSYEVSTAVLRIILWPTVMVVYQVTTYWLSLFLTLNLCQLFSFYSQLSQVV